MDIKIEFLDLIYLLFDTKHIRFGSCCSHGLQTAIYYEAVSCLRSLVRYIVISQVSEVALYWSLLFVERLNEQIIQPIKSVVLFSI